MSSPWTFEQPSEPSGDPDRTFVGYNDVTQRPSKRNTADMAKKKEPGQNSQLSV